MRALNISRFLSVAIFLSRGEASGAVEQEGKKVNKDERKLQYGYSPYQSWEYWDQYDYALTAEPTHPPTFKPTPYPTPRPTPLPTEKPTYMPTHYPTPRPTPHPTHKPTPRPTRTPTGDPVPRPTRKPTPNPTPDPTPMPTLHPTPKPTLMPTMEPSPSPSERPTPVPTAFPTPRPSRRPTPLPTTAPPTPNPTREPTPEPTDNEAPSEEPTETSGPSEEPTETSEPSENPTSTTTFSGSETLSLSSNCGERQSILGIICDPVNSNVLGDLCEAVENNGLEDLLNDCNRQLTVFAPSNSAFNNFYGFFDDEFFSNEDNFSFVTDGGIILDPSTRKLDVDEEFKKETMEAILSYHIVYGAFRAQDLTCGGKINMSARGTTETICDAGALVAQKGTCNGLNPRYEQVNILGANGLVHVVSNVLIPSPKRDDNTACSDIGKALPQSRSAILIATP